MDLKDYAFAPGETPYDRFARLLLGRIPNTRLVQANRLSQPAAGRPSFDVAAFINHLNTSAAIPKPIGNLLIAAHGDASGFMAIDLDRVSLDSEGKDATDTTYEVLDQAVASGSVSVPAALHANPPNPPVPFDVHIRGCRIGQAPPFVSRLKAALVGARSVTAPKHFHVAGAVGSRGKPTQYGSYEHLLYSFVLSRIRKLVNEAHNPAIHHFANRAEAVAQFHAADFKFIDGSSVPQALWNTWIPPNLQQQTPRRPVRLGRNIGRQLTRFRLEHEFRVRTQSFSFTITNVHADPGTDAQQEALLRRTVAEHSLFQDPPAHAFPIHQRHGFGTVNSFLGGHHWGCVWDQGTSELRCVGMRRIYIVIVPVVDPATDPDRKRQHLIFNLYPLDGSGLEAGPRLMKTDDKRLFLTV